VKSSVFTNFNQIEDGHVLHLVANPGVSPEQERGMHFDAVQSFKDKQKTAKALQTCLKTQIIVMEKHLLFQTPWWI